MEFQGGEASENRRGPRPLGRFSLTLRPSFLGECLEGAYSGVEFVHGECLAGLGEALVTAKGQS